ncbi:helix-turn-helix transcriptional regulator [Vibrio parahaemolyticus]|uniref:helix-turn-helix transcriptional regulator n=1 Tax=Vibrio parahaemolyticus TaxID=670 RepID=UPI001E4F0D76|nr:WYL domain-containing protein [Vibrio parahaemolyticus]
MKKLEELSHAQRERLAFIDFSLSYFGEVTRADLIAKFQTGLAAATRDFATYKDYAPNNMELVHQTKSYHRRDSFNPLFEHNAESILYGLSKGLGDGISSPIELSQSCIGAISLVHPGSETISTIMRAITQQTALNCEYVSLSSGSKQRVIVPHALASNGKRWHVRAYDRDSGSYRDFVATRFRQLSIVDTPIAASEKRESDKQWNRIVDITLIPHPKASFKEAIELDYSMENGELKLEIRAALVGYFLNQWSVDCSDEHILDANRHHLALKEIQSIFGVENNHLAPGYEQPNRCIEER